MRNIEEDFDKTSFYQNWADQFNNLFDYPQQNVTPYRTILKNTVHSPLYIMFLILISCSTIFSILYLAFSTDISNVLSYINIDNHIVIIGISLLTIPTLLFVIGLLVFYIACSPNKLYISTVGIVILKVSQIILLAFILLSAVSSILFCVMRINKKLSFNLAQNIYMQIIIGLIILIIVSVLNFVFCMKTLTAIKQTAQGHNNNYISLFVIGISLLLGIFFMISSIYSLFCILNIFKLISMTVITATYFVFATLLVRYRLNLKQAEYYEYCQICETDIIHAISQHSIQ
ncbi:MAG: hypothetical protein DBX47_00935 [Clostridiales bacterium]|nr:MAG: hypothetical protein DBX47_00935 [Clostridiales bacterium]